MNLFFCDISTLSDDKYEYYKQTVSKETLKKAERYRFEHDRRSCITGEGMVREKLSDLLNKKPEEIEIFRTDSGKPYIKENIYFNVSHSSGYVAIAISDNEIGVDIEKIRTPDFKTVKKFCTPNEENFIKDAESFFKVWTLKEAYLKCTGAGLSGGLKSISFELTDNNENLIKTYHIIGSEPFHSYIFKTITEKENYILSVCERKD